MRLIKVKFKGFRRLLDTGCNLDSKIIAFLGPNEAGKTSILDALHAFSTRKILPSDLARNENIPDNRAVVDVEFVIDESDKQALNDAYLMAKPNTRLLVGRSTRTRFISTNPPVQRDWTSLVNIAELVEMRMRVIDAPLTDEDNFLRSQIMTVLKTITRGIELNQEQLDTINLDNNHRTLALIRTTGVDMLLDQLCEVLSKSVFDHLVNFTNQRQPHFLLYSSDDRALQTRYAIGDTDFVAPASLVSLLKIAGLDLKMLIGTLSENSLSRTKTHLKAANRRLQTAFQQKWQQSRLSLRLDTDGKDLLVLVDELTEDGSITTVEERSDGLRAFLGIACSVLATVEEENPKPVILLLDEADRHLHYDAQADLINVLALQTQMQQVLYTTHSPGCLPPDLGTCVRLVEPSALRSDASIIRSNFWGSSAVGFSPLLLAMGAGAAAFSACRKAVLAEGATEMVLLPSLIRKAIGAPQLPYQIAPGLSSLRRDGLGLDEIAARVAYLTDGDEGGRQIAKLLLDLGVPDSHIVSMPENIVIEDLIDHTSYAEAISQLVSDATGQRQALTISGETSISLPKRVALACEAAGVECPSKIAAANFLVQDPSRITLAPSAQDILFDLHQRFCSILNC